MNLEVELKELLQSNGADLVGYADLTDLVEDELKYGVSVAVKLPQALVRSIANGPNIEYYEAYKEINAKLDQIVTVGADYIKKQGYNAVAQTVENVKRIGEYQTQIPHKTVAIHAGLGWIGKSAFFLVKNMALL